MSPRRARFFPSVPSGARLRLAFLAAALAAVAAGPADAAAKRPASGRAALLEQSPADFQAVIGGAKAKVFPAVVYLRCVVENFELGKQLRHVGAGSGVLISADGEFVTNWHVVDRALEIRCLLEDGRAFEAELIGSDKDSDLALLRLKLPPGETTPFAVFADGPAPVEGDFVMAMGAPWGMNRSVSFGIIACARRFLPEASEYSTWLQTDASISPGNSGGPLVDTRGRIVGINSRGSQMGGDLGFAVPVETVRLVTERLRRHGSAAWAWTGLQLQPLRDFQRNLVFPGTEGVIVAGTDLDSPAREAGFRPQDRIVAVGGRPVTALMEEDMPDTRRLFALLPVDEAVTVRVRRDGAELDLELRPRAKGTVLGREHAFARWDFTVKEINQFETPDLFFQAPNGLYVRGVRTPGNAGEAGLRPRDVLLKVNGLAVDGLDELRRVHAESLARLAEGGGRRLMLDLLRNGQRVQVILDLSRDYANP
jgi:serine protease Do